MFGVSRATAHRRFTEWTASGLWVPAPATAARARRDREDRLVAGRGRRDQRTRAKGGELAGPNPVDRGKPGSKIHVSCDRTGIPLTVLISAANTHDSQLLLPLLDSGSDEPEIVGAPLQRPVPSDDLGWAVDLLEQSHRRSPLSMNVRACAAVPRAVRAGYLSTKLRSRWVRILPDLHRAA
ncbi:transposase [Actinoplanes sp. NPDC049118]|uniref:transposase n=1 Tax=Actinoplanes sp. NPDC049118 TaxID=3155769 RepID=UPI0033FF7C49